jgi:voltage-gated sodium channel
LTASPSTASRPPTGAAAPASLLARMVTHPAFERFIIAIIVLNAITLGLETSQGIMAEYGPVLTLIDHVFLGIFVAELALRMVALRSRFWRDPWSWFDFAVVAIALVPATGEFAVMRALRILRALRLVTAVPSIRRVVGSLLSAIPGMSSIIILLLLINYVFAVMATKLFGAEFADKFGTLGASFFTFFQIMTLEGWSGEVVRPVMEIYPWAWAFFVPYIVLVTFMVLNLFIGIIVDAMQHQDEEPAPGAPAAEATSAAVLHELREMRTELADLRARLGA